MKLHTRILIGMVAGAVAGVCFGPDSGVLPVPGLVEWVEWIGRIFLALLKMVVVPLVFCSLVVGVASLGDIRKLGRMGGMTIVYFTTTTLLALIVGMTIGNVVQPGKLMAEEERAALLGSLDADAFAKVADASEAPGLVDQLVEIVPENPIESLAKGEMLQVIFFALMFGLALTAMEKKRARLVVDLAQRVSDAMVVLVRLVMKIAPYGVAVLLFKVVGTIGPSVLAALGVYCLVVLAGLVTHVGVVYCGVVKFGARMSLRRYFEGIRDAQCLAFSTSSSSATLPVTMECAEENLGVSREVATFVLPLGATVNMDGTALYQGVAALFIAQIYNIDLGFSQQAAIIVTATLASVGAAGVPGTGMVTLVMVLTQAGIPGEGLALILGVDRLLDMFRSVVNVTGDLTASVLVQKLEARHLMPLPATQEPSL